VAHISLKQVNYIFVHEIVKYVVVVGHKTFKCLYLIWMYIWQPFLGIFFTSVVDISHK
jgi:hypothetical protein